MSMNFNSINDLTGAERTQFLMNLISMNTKQINDDHENRKQETDEINQDVYSN